jgi:NAD(P)-dependent dehydrogenase (short-subunit alcohol dehydrogenase family)
MPVAVITGANRGIGLELAKAYLTDGWTVYGCCRNPDNAQQLQDVVAGTSGTLKLLKMDVTDYAQIDAAVTTMDDDAVDLLINNAGTADGYGSGAYENVDDPDPMNYNYELWMEVLQVNLLAPTRVTGAFADKLAKAEQPFVVMMSSTLASVSETWSAGRYAYRSSKAGLNVVMRSMGAWLEKRHIAIVSISPGWTKTDMGGPNAQNEPSESAEGVKRVIASLEFENTGSFYNFDGKQMSW